MNFPNGPSLGRDSETPNENDPKKFGVFRGFPGVNKKGDEEAESSVPWGLELGGGAVRRMDLPVGWF